MHLDLQLGCDFSPLPDEQQLQLWASLVLRRHPDSQCCLRIVDEQEIQQLNRDYRGKDYATNVLSFPFEYPPGMPEEDQHYLGDLAICAAVVWREAQEQKKEYLQHWAHMLVHGLLHLLGYDHENEADAEEMESLEISLLATLNIPDPYQDQGL